MPFRKQVPPSSRLSPDAIKRRATVTNLAFVELGGRDAALAFLNTHNDELDGRPIDVATATPEGSQQVVEAIRRLAGDASARP